MEFLKQQKFAYEGLVLDYVGTWALTRFIRRRVNDLKGLMLMMPPHYFLWEDRFFDEPSPDYTICIHPANNSWGDPTKRNWWRV